MLSDIVGICSDHHDPDLWFSDTDDDKGKGRPRKSELARRVSRTLEAIEICSNCPVKQACLELGMLPENIENGVWGGMMAGERMVIDSHPITNSLHVQSIEFAKKVRLLQSIHVEG